MTPDELRRLASRKIADAEALEADADRLRVQAAALDGLLEPLAPMSQRVWTGPAADEFEAKAATLSGLVNQQADRLREIAGDLVRRAVGKRSEAVELRARALAEEIVTTVVVA